MTNKVSSFLNNYNNNIITKTTTIQNFPDELCTPEIDIISQQLLSLSESIDTLLTLTKEASEEQVSTYNSIISTLNNKISYVDNISNMLMYINSYYDMNNVIDVKNIDIFTPSINSDVIFNSKDKAVTLKHVYSSYNCPKKIVENKITFYNTNLSYHSGININSNFIDLLNIKSIIVRKNNGDTVQLSFDSLASGDNYIKHDLLSSTQIDIEFNNDLYLDTVNLSLIDYKFIPDGGLTLNPITYKIGNVFNYIYSSTVPDNCFLNNETTIELFDINMNTIDKIDLLLPVGKTLVCKCLYDIDFSLVGSVVGVYYNNVFSNRSDLTNDYLNSIQNKKEVHVVFTPIMKESDVKTNNIELINNQGFIINNKNTKFIRVSTKLDLKSFNLSESPMIKAITGVTKYYE